MKTSLLLVALLGAPDYSLREAVTNGFPEIATPTVTSDSPEVQDRLDRMRATLRNRSAERRVWAVAFGFADKDTCPDPFELRSSTRDAIYAICPKDLKETFDRNPHYDAPNSLQTYDCEPDARYTAQTDAVYWLRANGAVIPDLRVWW